MDLAAEESEVMEYEELTQADIEELDEEMRRGVAPHLAAVPLGQRQLVLSMLSQAAP